MRKIQNCSTSNYTGLEVDGTCSVQDHVQWWAVVLSSPKIRALLRNNEIRMLTVEIKLSSQIIDITGI